MGVGTWLGGAYKDAICVVLFGHNYRYYRDLADLDKSLVCRFMKKRRFLKCVETGQRQGFVSKRSNPSTGSGQEYSKTYENRTETFKNYTKTIQKHSKTIRKYLNILARCPLFIVGREN